jgi:hypothetical protein
VALDGGYVVRYTLDGSGTFEDYFQGGGTLHLVYDTYDVARRSVFKRRVAFRAQFVAFVAWGPGRDETRPRPVDAPQ